VSKYRLWRRTARKVAVDWSPESMVSFRPSLIEFPADDPERARRFWSGVLGGELEPRRERQGDGWQTDTGGIEVGVHARGRGPGDSFSLPYFTVGDMSRALERVTALGGAVVHPGERWAVCRDCEGSPFGLALDSADA
jgi:predicted enzyme related to lactoylglutathione lyase